jgi:hypothetical protein
VKCIHCNFDNKLKARLANRGRCTACQHPFVFDPKAEKGRAMIFTDVFFQHFLDAATAQETLQVTRQQLFYVFNARYLRKQMQWLKVAGGFSLAAGVLLLIFGIIFSPWLFLPMLGAWLLAAFLLVPEWRERVFPKQPKAPPVTFSQFTDWLGRWHKVNGAPKKLLPPPQKQPPAPVSAEVAQYSFDRVVVCQRDSLAQFLIANHFHFEHNCAVLSLSGYPHNLFDTVMEMLRRNPDLKVYALHDASAEGLQMPRRLLTEKRWFREFPTVQIFDLGLMPRQVMNRALLLSERPSQPLDAAALPDALKQNLQPAELAWLSTGKIIELEAIHPQKLLQMIALGIAKSRDPHATDAYIEVYDSPNQGLYVYSSDSFG